MVTGSGHSSRPGAPGAGQEKELAMSAATDAPSEELEFLGSRARILADDDATGGRFGLVDAIEVPAGHMPPLHVHHAQDEGFYVLDGAVALFLPGRSVACGPGDFVLAPRGVPHAYRVGDRPARWLIISSPAGFERFVAEVAALDEVDPEALAALAAAHEIEILGPPGTLP
jgi:mannose-6-phosphate isomerase-like protein (cupin superfamily)